MRVPAYGRNDIEHTLRCQIAAVVVAGVHGAERHIAHDDRVGTVYHDVLHIRLEHDGDAMPEAVVHNAAAQLLFHRHQHDCSVGVHDLAQLLPRHIRGNDAVDGVARAAAVKLTADVLLGILLRHDQQRRRRRLEPVGQNAGENKDPCLHEALQQQREDDVLRRQEHFCDHAHEEIGNGVREEARKAEREHQLPRAVFPYAEAAVDRHEQHEDREIDNEEQHIAPQKKRR